MKLLRQNHLLFPIVRPTFWIGLKNFKKLLLAATCLVLCQSVVYAQAIKATGGSGAYRDRIWWLDFADIGEVQAGQTISRDFNVNGVQVTVTLDNISFGGKTPTDQRLIGYRSGGWVGDGFDNLYHTGGPNAANTLASALSGKITGTYTIDGLAAILNFRFRAYATVNGIPMDLGLVFANAEDDATVTFNGTPLDEFEQASTNGTAWQLLEKKADANAPANKKLTFFGNTARISAGSGVIYTGTQDPNGGNVAVLYTKKAATTAANQLESNMAIYGDGRAAIALGVVLDNDLGDAPTTYGTPANIYFADVAGGNPINTTTHDEYLSAGGSAPGGATIIQAGSVTPPSGPRLGTNLTDSDPATNYGPNANGDDVSGTSPNDEDALATIPPLTSTSASYAVTVPATSSDVPAYVTAWVDFNRNGTFEPSEFTSATVPANSTSNVTLSWPIIPAGTITPGTTYIRLRISTFDSTDPSNDLPGTPFDDRSTMALNNGEIEEYALTVPAPQPAFACTSASEGYLFQDATTDVFVVNIETGATNQVATDILGTTGNTQINAIGYNRTDNYIWGFRRGVNEIVRVGADWSVQTFPIAGLPVDGDFFIGDVDASGVLYLYNSAAYTTSIYRVDVNPASPTYLQALPALTTTASSITDWAISPNDSQIYAVDNSTLALYRFDPATGARTVVGTVTGGGIASGTFGAAYMDGDGALFVSHNETGNIYKIPAPHTGNTTAVFLATGPTSALNDGARCPAGSVASLALSGTVHNDPDGGNISGAGTNVGGVLYVNLTDENGDIMATQTVAADGTYAFENLAPGSYTVVLSTTEGTIGSPAPAASLPSAYVNTNEGLTPTGDGTVDGVIAITLTNADVANVDFAIQQPPVSVPVILPSQQNPGGTNTLDITSHFTGSDPDGTVTRVRFRTFPNEITTLTVNDTVYTAASFPLLGVIAPYGTGVLIDPVDAATTVIIPFSLLDNAGHESPISNVTIPFLPLPVTLARFDAVLSEQSVLLTWATTEETNSDHFEIQHSMNGKIWQVVGMVASSRESNALVHYDYSHSAPSAGENLYRLRMVDQDGSYAFSSIRSVRLDQLAQIVSYPNPATDKIKLRVNKPENIERIEVIGMDGRIVSDLRKTANSGVNTELNVRSLASGAYIVRITYSNGSVASDKIVKE